MGSVVPQTYLHVGFCYTERMGSVVPQNLSPCWGYTERMGSVVPQNLSPCWGYTEKSSLPVVVVVLDQ